MSAHSAVTEDRMARVSASFIRLGAVAGLGAAALGFLGDLYHVTLDRDEASLVFKLHGGLLLSALILSIATLFALALLHADHWRAVGRAGFWLAMAGTVLVAGDIYHEVVVTPSLIDSDPAFVNADPKGWHLLGVIASFAAFGLGWLLVGIATASSGLLSRASATVLAVGGLIGFTPLPGSYILLFIGLGLVCNDLRKSVST